VEDARVAQQKELGQMQKMEKELQQLQEHHKKLLDLNAMLEAELKAAKKKNTQLEGESLKAQLSQKRAETCADCEALKRKLKDLEQKLSDITTERDAAQEIVDRNNRVWGQVHDTAASEQQGKRIDNRLSDLMRFQPDHIQKLLTALRRFMGGGAGIAIHTWRVNFENALSSYEELFAKREADAGTVKGGFSNVDNIIARWRTAVVRRLVGNWRDALVAKKEAAKTEATSCITEEHIQEVGELQNGLQQSQDQAASLESELSRIREELRKANDEANRESVENKTLRDELDKLKQAQEKLEQEKQSERDALERELDLRQSSHWQQNIRALEGGKPKSPTA